MRKKRKFYLLFVLSLYFNLINAQIGSSEVFTNIELSNDVRAFSSNDEMFYVQKNETGGCYLAKIENLNSTNLPINEEVFVVDLPGSQGDYKDLEYLQNNLYLLISPVSGEVKILKVNISSINPQVSEIAKDINLVGASGISGDGENLYTIDNTFAAQYPLKNIKIYKYNTLNQETSLLLDIENDFSLFEPHVIGSKMYFTGFNSIFRINLDNPSFSVNENFYTHHQTRITSNKENNHLFKINSTGKDASLTILDVSEDSPNILFQASGIFSSGGLEYYHNGFVYYGNFRRPINYSEILSTQENKSNNLLKVFPNPVNSYLQIDNQKEKLNFEIYNSIGKKILSGELKIDEEINVNRLKTGQYILKIKNNTSKQVFIFIKN
jgi:hypothetical protein